MRSSPLAGSRVGAKMDPYEDLAVSVTVIETGAMLAAPPPGMVTIAAGTAVATLNLKRSLAHSGAITGDEGR